MICLKCRTSSIYIIRQFRILEMRNKVFYSFLSAVTRNSINMFLSPSGYYCEAQNITVPTGLCSPGYYCVLRAYTPQPNGSDETGGPCEQGTYCTEGSSYPTFCPQGTFGHVDKLPSESNCTDCWPGYFCMEVGLTEPNGTCYSGNV